MSGSLLVDMVAHTYLLCMCIFRSAVVRVHFYVLMYVVFVRSVLCVGVLFSVEVRWFRLLAEFLGG